MPLKMSCSRRSASQIGLVNSAPPVSPRVTWTSACGSVTGRERSRRALKRLKIAVLAPMPRPRESITVSVNPGEARSPRTA